jgi:outer membrane lipoprotein SlyB
MPGNIARFQLRKAGRQNNAERLCGTVMSVNQVTIEGEPGPIGLLAGGATGAAVGQTIGSGRGRTAATVIGGAAGALAGAAVEKKVTTKQGIEITVQLDDGRTVAIVQEVDPEENFTPGDYVNIIQGQMAPQG